MSLHVNKVLNKLQTNVAATITSYIGIHPSISASPAAVMAVARTDPSFSNTNTLIWISKFANSPCKIN